MAQKSKVTKGDLLLVVDSGVHSQNWRPWNYQQDYDVDAGETQNVVDITGEGIILSIGIVADGGSLDAEDCEVELYFDGETNPSFVARIDWLRTLGGGMPGGTETEAVDAYFSAAPMGMETVRDLSLWRFGGYVNMAQGGGFRTGVKIKVVNGDSTNATTIAIFVYALMRTTKTLTYKTLTITTYSGTGGGGGNPPVPF